MAARKKKPAVDHDELMARFIKVIVDAAPPLSPEARATVAAALSTAVARPAA